MVAFEALGVVVAECCDVVVLGAGPAGEAVVRRLEGSGLDVVVVERELVGGECAHWACVPSKTLLRAPEARAAARRVRVCPSRGRSGVRSPATGT